MIENVFIQCMDDGEFSNLALSSAWFGFEFRGREVTRMTADEIEGRTPRPEDLVFGGVEVVRPYLAKLGVEPAPIDYPVLLQPWLHRKVERTTLQEVRRRYQSPGPPMFIKPVEHKLVTGHIVRRFGDLSRWHHTENETEVYLVEPVKFISEWRFYIEGSRVVGVDHYKGNPLFFPDRFSVEAMARAYAVDPKCPAAYTLDVGRTEDDPKGPSTRLVEVNDMISVGSYGLDSAIYAGLIEKRWDQLVKPLLSGY